MVQETQELILLAHQDNQIDDEEFILLYEDQEKRNLDLPYWKYEKFDLENMENDECVSEFRFEKDDIIELKNALLIPDRICCYNGTIVSSVEALCIF